MDSTRGILDRKIFGIKFRFLALATMAVSMVLGGFGISGAQEDGDVEGQFNALQAQVEGPATLDGIPNPGWPRGPQCGIGLVFDRSNSIGAPARGGSPDNVRQIKSAALQFVDAFLGSDTYIKSVSFAQYPETINDWINVKQGPFGADLVKIGIGTEHNNGLPPAQFNIEPGGQTGDKGYRGITNLQGGIDQVAGGDLLIVFTDGKPTTRVDAGAGLPANEGFGGPGDTSSTEDKNGAIAAANAAKARGARIVAVGVSSRGTVDEDVLRRISGPTAGEDYFMVGSAFSTLGARLQEIANQACKPEVIVEGEAPRISVDKVADKTSVVRGQVVNYSFTVTNDGNVPLSSVALNDDKLGAINLTATSLNPGGTATGTASWTVPVDFPGTELTNVATASGVSPQGTTVTAQDTWTVAIPSNPSVKIDKTGPETLVCARKTEDITYKFTVTNTGNVRLVNLEVTDDLLDPDAPIKVIDQLEPGASVQFEHRFTVDCSLDDDESTTTSGPTTSVSASSSTSSSLVDATVPAARAFGGSSSSSSSSSSTSSTSTTQPANEEPETVVNTAVVCGQPVNNAPKVCDEDDHVVQILRPDVQIIKEGPEFAEPGTTITYSFTVTNVGDVPLVDLKITDDVLGDLGTIDRLEPGESKFTEVDFEVPKGKDKIINTAIVCGLPDGIDDVEVCDDDDHVLTPQQPIIDIEKTADPTQAQAGTVVTYTYVITNNGEVTLTDLVLTDDKLGGIELEVTELKPGESTTVTATYTVQSTDANLPNATIINTAIVEGITPEGNTVTDQDTAEVAVLVVSPATVTAPPAVKGALAFTGSSRTGLLIRSAIYMLAGGSMLVIAARRKKMGVLAFLRESALGRFISSARTHFAE